MHDLPTEPPARDRADSSMWGMRYTARSRDRASIVTLCR